MNMTGDPNQRNRPPMFGFECSYPNSNASFPRFGEGSTSVTSPLADMSRVDEATQCLFASSSSSPFPTADGSFTTNYIFPSTSSLNMPVSTSYPFPFSMTSREGSGNFPANPAYANTTQIPSMNPFLGNHLNWNLNFKSNLTFPVSSSNATNVTNSFTTRPLTGMFGCKRKTESPPLVPVKQHITEERMAEHMSRLHISSQTPAGASESQPIRERRLYMCEEMQRLQTESIIPAQILEKVHRPCTALVPWRPRIVPPMPKENNNNEEEPDNNFMERSDSNGMDMDS